jgi:hypothetical protein
LSFGVLLLVFPTALYLNPIAVSFGGRVADAMVGFAGGILGGLAGLSGPLPILWASVRGWGKDERRGVFQTFNWTILTASLCLQAATCGSRCSPCRQRFSAPGSALEPIMC